MMTVLEKSKLKEEPKADPIDELDEPGGKAKNCYSPWICIEMKVN